MIVFKNTPADALAKPWAIKTMAITQVRPLDSTKCVGKVVEDPARIHKKLPKNFYINGGAFPLCYDEDNQAMAPSELKTGDVVKVTFLLTAYEGTLVSGSKLEADQVKKYGLTQNLTKRGHLYPHNYDALMQRLKETKTCYSLSFSATKHSTLPVLGGVNPFTRGLLRHTCWTQCMFEVRRQATDYWLWNARDPCMMPGTGLCIKLNHAHELPLIEQVDSLLGIIDLGPLFEMSPLSLQRCFCWADFQIQRIVNVTRIPSPNMSKAKPYKCDAKSVYERVARGANYYNGFTRDGWGVMHYDGKDELRVAGNKTCEAHKYDCLCGAKGTYCSESHVHEPYIPAHYIPEYNNRDWG
ncbi:hypothetical protein BCR37DRAFT_392209 [Protomyces lactucae-debilis]|uniref:Uncharacterized protein n=1 Tax=Protomyces lactucae-debilis TaxID=2754530 RepID=A0A1Y2FII1_PROLT|nr:uncharacterized protein BCR37DRAFT_392209 [Protomyces lactucae-debilis]ORY83749.1 hypothetical protein BCR37DRAFT_392209 [Protomyces lactucae-debilis]